MSTQSPKYFGTDGLRGMANTGMLTPERVLALGRALGRMAKNRGGRFAIAQDPRRSSPLLSGALAAGAAAEGEAVLDLGVLPTPGLAALLPSLDAAIGAMVSASHNPMPDNGIKVMDGAGGKLPNTDELWLEAQMEVAPDNEILGADVGSISLVDDSVERYLAHVLGAFPGLSLAGMSVVVDAAHGAMSVAGPRAFERLGAKVITAFASPDGLNINQGCGAVHPDAMARMVVEHGADVGVAFDGDGDRLMMASAEGVVQDGDRILYVVAGHRKAQGKLPGDAVVGTVMTNFGLELAFKEQGIRLERTPVGDRHVAVRLREGAFGLGGEPSGHVIFGAENRFIGDGLYSALGALSVLRATGRTFADLTRGLKAVPQELINVRVSHRPPLDQLLGLQDRILAAEAALNGEGRVLIRYSGTENLLRVMVEGADAALVNRLSRELADAALEEIGAP